MNRDNERLKIVSAPDGKGEIIIEAKPGDKEAQTAAAHRIEDSLCVRCGKTIEDSLCVRCGKTIGRGPFVRISGQLHTNATYHLKCAVV